MQRIYEKIVELIHNKKEFVLAAVIDAESSTSGKSGFKMIILKDRTTFGTVGGGALEKDVIDNAMDLFKTRKPIFKTYVLREGDKSSLGMVCGGTISVYMEYVGPAEQFVIFGAGHIGKMLYDMLLLNNTYDIIVADTRKELANGERFPKASISLADDFYDVTKALPLRDRAIVVIVTTGGKDDPYILKALSEKNIKYGYIGMIGSMNRKDKCFEKARALGINDEFLNSIHAPIGIAIGGDTPFEISIAILAEIIAAQKGTIDKIKTEKEMHNEEI